MPGSARRRSRARARDITLVSAMKGVDDCLEAAEPLAGRASRRGHRPADDPAARRGDDPALAGEDQPPRCRRGGAAHRRLGGRGVAIATEQGLGDIDDALRITTPDTPIPYSPPLEDDFLPGRAADRGRGPGAHLTRPTLRRRTWLRRRSSRCSAPPAPRAAGSHERSWRTPTAASPARAITRDPSSEKAKELAAAGAEVVGGDVDDEGSLASAFAGAYGAYCVTFFWAHFSPELELEQAGKMARAAKAAGLAARDLVDARGHARVHPARRRAHADARRALQGAPLRRQGRGQPALHRPPACRRPSCRPRSTGRTSSTSGWAPSAARTAR